MATVKEKIINQCRMAMLSGIPIVYIKTDSDLMIRDIFLDFDHPLVVPVCSCSGVEPGFGNRPASERVKAGRPTDESKIVNYSFNTEYKYLSREENYTVTLPQLRVFKMPEEKAAKANFCRVLEKYVVLHADKRFPTHNVLQASLVVVYSNEVELSSFLHNYTEIIEADYPDRREIHDTIIDELYQNGIDFEKSNVPPEQIKSLETSFQGFSEAEIRTAIRRISAFVPQLRDSKQIDDILVDLKKQKMRSDLLDYVGISDHGLISGMGEYTDWLTKNKESIKNYGVYRDRIGTPPPKGVLLCGIPGCGKSEAAMYTSYVLELPLLKMDIGSMMDKFQGVSERRMRDALKLAEEMSPCILWIDELEKAFDGSNSEEEAPFKRMFGYMLTWMQMNDKPCFIFATANNIGKLPKEFFRSGRFEELFAVYLPTAEECAGIIVSSLERNLLNQRDDGIQFDGRCLETDFYLEKIVNSLLASKAKPRVVIGADIQKIVNTAMRSFINSDNSLITEKIWIKALESALEDCNVYGDGAENVDSIAVTYCRLLKKSFRPTAYTVLFHPKDYHPENAEKWRKIEENPDGFSEELLEKEKKKSGNAIIPYNNIFNHQYDKMVYELLWKRINHFAPKIEEFEGQDLISR